MTHPAILAVNRAARHAMVRIDWQSQRGELRVYAGRALGRNAATPQDTVAVVRRDFVDGPPPIVELATALWACEDLRRLAWLSAEITRGSTWSFSTAAAAALDRLRPLLWRARTGGSASLFATHANGPVAAGLMYLSPDVRLSQRMRMLDVSRRPLLSLFAARMQAIGIGNWGMIEVRAFEEPSAQELAEARQDLRRYVGTV